MSITVASHTRCQPALHGMRVVPSGLLPSALWLLRSEEAGFDQAAVDKVVDGSVTSSAARKRAQERMCVPLPVTSAPHAHVCGWHKLAPRRRLTTTLIALRLSLRLHGKQPIQSSACWKDTAFRLACSLDSVDD